MYNSQSTNNNSFRQSPQSQTTNIFQSPSTQQHYQQQTSNIFQQASPITPSNNDYIRNLFAEQQQQRQQEQQQQPQFSPYTSGQQVSRRRPDHVWT